MINVTKTFLPPFKEYEAILKRSYERGWITNNGELLQELEEKLKEYLGVKHLFFCSNGTIVLQMAIKVFGITKEVITTPFSYVATTSAILWQNCKPVYVDIDPRDYNIDASLIEDAITNDTEAIIATHVYGNPCNIEMIETIARKHGLRVIYDAAHCFGVNYKGRSLLSYGDISTCSFHATKLFHTVEGGAIITDDDEIAEKLMLFRQFGHVYDDHFSEGINAKNSEFHAAMGLAVLPYVDGIIRKRKEVSELYDKELKEQGLSGPVCAAETSPNYGYYPILLGSESELLEVAEILRQSGISSRRYFYPSLNKLPYLDGQSSLPNSESISRRVLCLPLYDSLDKEDVLRICTIIRAVAGARVN